MWQPRRVVALHVDPTDDPDGDARVVSADRVADHGDLRLFGARHVAPNGPGSKVDPMVPWYGPLLCNPFI